MIFRKKHTEEEIPMSRDWKEKNKRYLNQIQKFLDATDSIEREEIKNNVIAQMLRCDQILTELAEREIKKYRKQDMNNNNINEQK